MFYSLSANHLIQQKGATLVEPIIILPLFLIIFFGVIEYSYAYRSKATLNMASFEAVRQGALSNAMLKPMKTALSAGMASEYSKGDNSALGLINANARAKMISVAIDTFSRAEKTISVISPTKEVFNKHKIKTWVRLSNDNKERRRNIIPNDNLYWRNPVAKAVKVNGKNLHISVQDANLLKIKTLWCHRLVTPGLDRILYETLLRPVMMLGATKEQRACNALTRASIAGNIISGGVIPRGYYLAMTSQAIMRMQTPVFNDGKNLR